MSRPNPAPAERGLPVSMVARPAPDPSTVRVPGPWTHRDVSANGIRLHVAEAGSGPLVLMLHGFPEFWWTWRHQLTALSSAGFHAVAVDLRGYGDSDKPPRGYDGWTLAGDVAGLIKVLGERKAHVVGHGWGGLIGWTLAAMHPRLVRSLSALAAPHPLALRQQLRRGAALRRGGQARAIGSIFRAQLPIIPERTLVANGAAEVERLMRLWSGPRWPGEDSFREVAAMNRTAMLVPGTAHCALEYFRWAIRSQVRGDGRRFAHEVTRLLPMPVLQVHGTYDPYLLDSTARASAPWLGPRSRYHSLPAVGHFPHEEAPVSVTGALIDFIAAEEQRHDDPAPRRR